MWQLHNFDAIDFLANCWQQRPLLIRQALPGFESLVTPEELAGLACEQEVHSRLVIERGADSPWQLRYGPFAEADFTSLPSTHYSLLVSECEKWLPELRDLLDCFEFLPRWRIDDVMISYAPEHGSVGPHIDEYDVFLIQAAGTRRWSIETALRDEAELIPDLDLAILRRFAPDQTWDLQPGDMLYLPPKFAHLGVAVGDGCMTYSIGFRAPSLGDVMDSLLMEASEQGLTDRRYQDPALDPTRNPAEIHRSEIRQFQTLVEKMMDDGSGLWPDAIGKLVSDATLSGAFLSKRCATLDQASTELWQKHPDTRLFYLADEPLLRIYCNGEAYPLVFSEDHLTLCKILGNQTVIDIPIIAGLLSQEATNILLTLINSQALIPVVEDDD